MAQLGIGLYGTYGHQIQGLLASHPRARLRAVAAFDPAALPEALRADGAIRRHETLDQLLDDPDVDLVSFCSPRRGAI